MATIDFRELSYEQQLNVYETMKAVMKKDGLGEPELTFEEWRKTSLNINN